MMIKYYSKPRIHPIITYRKALDKFLLNFTPYLFRISYFYTIKLIFVTLPSHVNQLFEFYVKGTSLFVQVIICIVIALKKYMYYGQRSYTDRVRMRREWNNCSFYCIVLYCIVMCVVGDIYCFRHKCTVPVLGTILQVFTPLLISELCNFTSTPT